MLRLVHPAREGQDPLARPPKGRCPAVLRLTPEEGRHVRAALVNVARAYGGVAVLASVIGVPPQTLWRLTGPKGQPPSAILAIRLAKAAGMSTEAILTGQLSPAGRCQACGSRIGEGRAAS
jgi:hypothetical protein